MEDFRINKKKQHLLTYIIAITFAAILSGMKSYDEIKDFGFAREAWLRTFLELSNGRPYAIRVYKINTIIKPVIISRPSSAKLRQRIYAVPPPHNRVVEPCPVVQIFTGPAI